jgi:site-specific DNA recombinase
MPHHTLRVAISARVSGEQQVKDDPIASQLAALTQRVASDGWACEPELCFVDDGYTGDILVRPGLERLRDQAAAGVIDRLYMLDPDRFSRRYADPVLLLEELTRCGVAVVFWRNPIGRGPEEDRLRQVQGMMAEYERAKIMERCRRGKQDAARHGSVNVLSGAPYGYRDVGKHEGGGAARYQVVAEEARIVRKIFEWVGQERCALGEVCRRLQRAGVPTRTGKSTGDRSVIGSYLKNPAYPGTAGFGKTRAGDLKPQRLRPQRGRPEPPRRPVSRVDTCSEEQIFIEVPARVGEDRLATVPVQLAAKRRRRRERPGGGRYLLQGLVVCQRCGSGCSGKPVSRAAAKGKVPYAYYRGTGSDAYRFGGPRLCGNKPVRTDVRDAAVWEDVRQLLSEPERVRAEYERRLPRPETGAGRAVKHLNNMIANGKKMISRLIDAYGEGLLDKSEFEPRILAARERLAKLEDACRQPMDEATREEELRRVIGQLEEFARRVSQELQEPDWATRREVVRALVKQVEIDEQEVRIV